MKKILSTFVALAAITTMGTTVFAQNVDVNGVVEPISTLNVITPVGVSFTIDEARDFICAGFEVTNQAPVPVTVTAESISAKTTTPVKVVAETAHTDREWNSLSKAATQSQIALGLITDSDASSLVTPVADTTKWFSAEGTDSSLALGTIESAYGKDSPPKMVLDMNAKYGKAWNDIKNISYDLVLTFSVE